MLYGLLVTLFVILCFLLIAVILIQKSRSSMGFGALGGSAQMLFGGSGGQDLFQKVTWVMVALFMAGSLVLAIMKSTGGKSLGFVKRPAAQEQLKPRPLTKTQNDAPSVPASSQLAQNTVPAQQTTPAQTPPVQ